VIALCYETWCTKNNKCIEEFDVDVATTFQKSQNSIFNLVREMINGHKISDTNTTPSYFNYSHILFLFFYSAQAFLFFFLLSDSHVHISPLSLSFAKSFLFLFSITLSSATLSPVTIRRRHSLDLVGGRSEPISSASDLNQSRRGRRYSLDLARAGVAQICYLVWRICEWLMEWTKTVVGGVDEDGGCWKDGGWWWLFREIERSTRRNY